MNLIILKELLTKHEGERFSMYKDTVGKWTIGVGHNLSDKPISKRASQIILEDDINDVLNDLTRALPWWRLLTEARQIALADMCFNLGLDKLLGFKQFLGALKDGHYDDAAKHGLDSIWAKQVGSRAVELMTMIKEG